MGWAESRHLVKTRNSLNFVYQISVIITLIKRKSHLGEVLLCKLRIYLPVIDSLPLVMWYTIDKGQESVYYLNNRLCFTSSIIS